jgi:hypothetical protein
LVWRVSRVGVRAVRCSGTSTVVAMLFILVAWYLVFCVPRGCRYTVVATSFPALALGTRRLL